MIRAGLDAARAIWQIAAMNPFRALFLVLIVLAVLPWGAFASAQVPASAGVAQPDMVARAQVLDDPAPGAKVTVGLQRRCPGPALPGAPCQPDHVLLPVQTEPPEDRPMRAPVPHSDAVRAGLNPSRPLDPPRTV